MTLPYDTGFPVPGDSLGTTQAKFFNNTASVKSLINVNHYDFSNTLYGNHKWVTYGEATSVFPNLTGTLATAIATYGASDGTRTQLWLQPSGDTDGTQAIQLTAGDVKSANFATNTLYLTQNDVENVGGWTFLPGNLILQYGRANRESASSDSLQIKFPLAFSLTPYSIVVTVNNSGALAQYATSVSVTSNTGFTFRADSNLSTAKGVFWTAIGPA